MSVFLRMIALVALLLTSACSDSGPEATSGGPRPGTPVVLAEASVRVMEEALEVVGTARADESVTLSSKITEKIRALHFEDGQFVRKGDLLVEMTNREESARLGEALAELREDERNYRRVQDLIQSEVVSQADMDEAEARYRTARSRVRTIEAQLADRVILAPFDGTLGLRQVSAGALIEPGDPIVTLDDVDPIKADFSVPERFVARLSQGQSVRAEARAYPDDIFEGVISALPPRVSDQSRSVTVRALIPNEDGRLRPGMLLTMEIVKQRRETLTIPEAALSPRGEEQFVFVHQPEEGVVHRKRVVIGLRIPGFVEVREGLTPGDLVVTEGVTRITDGARVEPRDAPMPGAMTGGEKEGEPEPGA